MLKQASRFSQVVHVSVNLPWPFSDRDVVLYGQGIDILEQQSVMILASGLKADATNPFPDLQVPAPADGVARVGMLEIAD